MRRKRRRKMKILPFVLLGVAACALVMHFVFVVRDVEIIGGTGSMSQEDVVRAADVGLGSSIFRVNEEEIGRRINSTGVLRLMKVERDYPDTVRIVLEERNKEAMVLYMGRIRILDEEGYVVESLDQVPPADLVYVSGMQIQNLITGEILRADNSQMEAYRAVIGAVNAHGADLYVSELDLGNVEDISIITRSGITVRLGNSANMLDKIAWMRSAVADLENRGQKGGTLDVSSGTKADYRP